MEGAPAATIMEAVPRPIKSRRHAAGRQPEQTAESRPLQACAVPGTLLAEEEVFAPMELSVWLTPAIIVAVAALLLRSNSRIEERLGARIDETNKRIDETNRRLDGIDNRLRAVEHGQARLEGLMDGLREAISGRRPAA